MLWNKIIVYSSKNHFFFTKIYFYCVSSEKCVLDIKCHTHNTSLDTYLYFLAQILLYYVSVGIMWYKKLTATRLSNLILLRPVNNPIDQTLEYNKTGQVVQKNGCFVK